MCGLVVEKWPMAENDLWLGSTCRGTEASA